MGMAIGLARAVPIPDPIGGGRHIIMHIHTARCACMYMYMCMFIRGNRCVHVFIYMYIVHAQGHMRTSKVTPKQIANTQCICIVHVHALV